MSTSIVNRLFQALFCAAFLCIVVMGVVLAYPKYRQVKDLNEQHDRILREIAKKRAEIEEIRDRQRRFNTDREFVAELARRDRRVFPGEMVFVFDH